MVETKTTVKPDEEEVVKHSKAVKTSKSDEEVNIFKVTDAQTLSVDCPVCHATITQCIYQEVHGGNMVSKDPPHRERVMLAHKMTAEEADLYVAEHEVSDLQREQKDYEEKIKDAQKKLDDLKKEQAERENTAKAA